MTNATTTATVQKAMTGDDLFPKGTYTSIPLAVLRRKDLSPVAKLTYLGLTKYLRGQADRVWPGTKALQDATGLSRRAVQKGVASLVAAKVIGYESGASEKGTNLYIFGDWRTECASAQNAPPLAHGMRTGSARRAPEVLKRSTTGKYSTRGAAACRPPDPRVKTFLHRFASEYKHTLGRDYIIVHKKDEKIVKSMLQALGGNGADPVDVLVDATRTMLADEWGREAASIGILLSQINRWRGGGRAAKRGATFTPATASANADLSKIVTNFGATT